MKTQTMLSQSKKRLIFASILFSISTPYSNFIENDNINHIITEHTNITLPALLKKAIVLSYTSLITYFAFGILYSGNSEMYVLLVFLYINFFITIAVRIITNIAKKYKDAETRPEFFPKKYPENNAIIGNLALHGINGVNIAVISLSS